MSKIKSDSRAKGRKPKLALKEKRQAKKDKRLKAATNQEGI